MYKKVKNSSLMNWFWFIIYILPLIFLGLFAINFYRDDEITINTEDISVHYDNLIDYNNLNMSNGSIDLDNKYIYVTLNDNADVYIRLWSNTGNSYNLNSSGYFYYFVDNENVSSTNVVDKFQFRCNYFQYGEDYDDTYYRGIGLIGGFAHFDKFSFGSSDESGMHLSFYLKNRLGSSTTFKIYFGYIDNSLVDFESFSNYFLNNTNNNSFDISLSSSSESDLNQYLQSNFFNTFSHNGILYNMFINLFSYFGVFNIYIQIISVYLEYIILISLIHLAVDFLLLLPNICHKFMEKVGGERD